MKELYILWAAWVLVITCTNAWASVPEAEEIGIIQKTGAKAKKA